ncbi:MAG: metallophosphoesterase [Verrucomicrobiae bacterium]|nr:metallophosphoesterase [Verrucomicrobiae bacterium]
MKVMTGKWMIVSVGLALLLNFRLLAEPPLRGVIFNDANENGAQDPGEEGIEGVGVSDGLGLTVSGVGGKYELASTKRMPFLFVCVPTDFRPTKAWYYDLRRQRTGDFSFGLVKRPQAREFFAAHFADMHVTADPREGRLILDAFARQVDALNASREKPSLILVLGDQANSPSAIKVHWPAYLANYKGGIPMFFCAGNHEMQNGDKNPYWDCFGPSYYAFAWAGFHFIVLDPHDTHIPLKNAHNEKFHVRLDDDQLEWLKKYLKQVVGNQPVLICGHEPDFIRALKPVFEGVHVVATLHGHLHRRKTLASSENAGFCGYVASSVKESRDLEVVEEVFSWPGYNLYCFANGKLERWFWRYYDRKYQAAILKVGPLSPCGQPPITYTLPVKNKTLLEIGVYPKKNGIALWRIDKGEWRECEPVREEMLMDVYRAEIDPSQMEMGLHTLCAGLRLNGNQVVDGDPIPVMFGDKPIAANEAQGLLSALRIPAIKISVGEMSAEVFRSGRGALKNIQRNNKGLVKSLGVYVGGWVKCREIKKFDVGDFDRGKRVFCDFEAVRHGQTINGKMVVDVEKNKIHVWGEQNGGTTIVEHTVDFSRKGNRDDDFEFHDGSVTLNSLEYGRLKVGVMKGRLRKKMHKDGLCYRLSVCNEKSGKSEIEYEILFE